MSASFNPRWTQSTAVVFPTSTIVRMAIPPFGFFPAATQVRVFWGDGTSDTFFPNTFLFGYDVGHVYADAPAPYRVVVQGLEGGAPIAADVLFATIHSQATTPLVLVGTARDDLMQAGSGADSLLGGRGDDLLVGGLGADTLNGGPGDDILRGQEDDDVLLGGTGDDSVEGGTGNDSLLGQDGDDDLRGQEGDDTLRGGNGNDTLFGDDFILGISSNDLLYGDAGDDVLFGGGDNDTLIGGLGNDRLHGGDGNDRLIGGDGADYYEASTGRDTMINTPDGDADFFYWGSPLFNQTVINGFETGLDRIRLAFLFETDFFAGSNPLADAPPGTEIFYDTDDGRLFVHPFGEPSPILLIRFAGAPVLSAGDFMI